MRQYLIPGGDKPSKRLRFGVICHGPDLRMWEARCLTNLVDSGLAELALVLRYEPPDSVRSVSSESSTGPKSLLFRVYRRLLARSYAFSRASVSRLFDGVPTVVLRHVDGGSAGGPSEKPGARDIQAYDLDFVLQFAFSNSQGDPPAASRYGTWWFAHDEDEKRGSGAPFFREISGDGDVTRALLLSRGADGPARTLILREGYFPTIRDSYCEHIDTVYFECAKWPVWACSNILNEVTDFRCVCGSDTVNQVSEAPSGKEIAALAGRMFGRMVRKKIVSLVRHPQWNVGIIDLPIAGFLEPRAKPQVAFLDAGDDKAKFRADPFGIIRGGNLTILFEEYDHRRRKGRISYVEPRGERGPFRSQTVFDTPFHMSYPYLFEYEGEIYCVPETAASGRMEILKALDFPRTWEKVAEIGQDIAGLDPTLFQHGGLWWAAFTDYGNGADMNLFLLFAERLTGPWKPHARNPVKSDVRSSRPAGTPFTHEGELFRPAQDSSRSYGGRVTINRVARLTPTEFEEAEAAVVEPSRSGPFPDGLHTLCGVGDITIIDGLRHVFIGAVFRRVLSDRWRKTVSALRNILFPTPKIPSNGGGS